MQSRREFLTSAALFVGGAALGCGRPGGTASVARARRAGAGFFAACQSSDGAWRSAQTGAFREGDALTPLVLWALEGQPETPAACRAAGLRWLEKLTDTQAARREPWEGLSFPLFTAGYAAQVLAREGDGRRAGFWGDVVDGLRISRALGWPATAVACGAWGDAATPPQLPSVEGPTPDMLAPNVSATQLALQALQVNHRAGAKAALPFLTACQNLATAGSDPGDDGGFVFALDDSVRNKAGVAERGAAGRARYRSYGSATCDGVLAMAACGLGMDDGRLRAAFEWLHREAAGARHSGKWPVDRADDREALRFYHAQAFAAVLELAGTSALLSGWVAEQRRLLVAELLADQGPEGAWKGTRANSFEDDPLVATAFALRALRQMD